jgi:hypothetical protein
MSNVIEFNAVPVTVGDSLTIPQFNWCKNHESGSSASFILHYMAFSHCDMLQ